MSAHLLCPRCNIAIPQSHGESPPPNCPGCGARILCPRCGSTLRRGGPPTSEDYCANCQAPVAESDTEAFASATQLPAEGALQLPGFELLGELGRGGMGIVYRARQLSLGREVAIKVLPPPLARNAHLLERFRNEASVAAGLVDSHIVPVFDVLEIQGVPVIVMPLVEGCDLGRILADRARVKSGQPPKSSHPWVALDDRAYLDRVLPLLDKIITTVAALHRAGVLHRDIKPSNVLVDEHGNHWLSDFGLARLEEQGAGTRTGAGLGTPGYMSPEQTIGEVELDARTDLFSLGVTLYQALTLELPYGKRAAAVRLKDPPPPSRKQPLLPRDFDAVILKAIEWDRDQRYRTAVELAEDWGRVRKGLLPKARPAGPVGRAVRWTRKNPAKLVTALSVCGLAAALFGLFGSRGPANDATPVKAPPAEIPPAPPANRFLRTVRVTTSRAGARVALVPIDGENGRFIEERALRPEARTPLTIPDVPPGQYLVVAALDSGEFHEVYRTIPSKGETPGPHWHNRWDESEGVVTLCEIRFPPRDVTKNMVRFAGGVFPMGRHGAQALPVHERLVPAYYLDQTEVTVGEFGPRMNGLPAQLAAQPPPANHAVTWVTFDQALQFAEKVGKRLPDEAEYEFAATARGRTKYPWGDEDKVVSWQIGEVGKPDYDRTNTDPPVRGLFSNAAEWTTTWFTPYPSADPAHVARFFQPFVQRGFYGTRVVRGGPFAVVRGDPARMKPDARIEWEPRYRHAISANVAEAGLGFRCARSEAPRFLPALERP